jgi:hypothetical protein
MSNAHQAEVVNENTNAPSTEPTTSIVDAVFDVGQAWAEVGLGQARLALEGSARALQRTAKALDLLRERVRPQNVQ